MTMSFRTVLQGLACALVVIAGATIPEAQVQAQAQATTRMYRLSDGGEALIPVDPMTLRDLKGTPGIRLVPPGKPLSFPTVVSTPTGTALATEFYTGAVESAKTLLIQVIDVQTGKPRGPLFHPAVTARIDGISEDGSKLSATAPDDRGVVGSAVRLVTHYVLSSKDGHVLRTWTAREFCCGQNLYDQAHQRLYSLMTPHADDPKSASQIPTLLVQDLRSNRQRGRLALPNLHAGTWKTNQNVSGEIPVRGWDPAFVLRADGQQIAIVDPSTNRLIVIDTATLTVVRSVSLVTHRSLLEMVGSWLGVLPDTAFAKGMEGVSLYGWYSPDAQLLYLTGTQGHVTKKHTFAWTQLGLRVVDVNDGTVLANRFHGSMLETTDLSPDGKSLYISTPGKKSTGGAFGCPCLLQRLDARTLATEATRPAIANAYTSPSIYFLAARRS